MMDDLSVPTRNMIEKLRSDIDLLLKVVGAMQMSDIWEEWNYKYKTDLLDALSSRVRELAEKERG
jgi:hypothetical protein